MYIKHNIEVCFANHCCGGKAISITYSECVFVALGIQHAMCVCHIVICGLPACLCNIFPRYLINGMIKKSYCRTFVY
jgi:hypothetical protein